MITGVSHDLRTPLTSILGYLELIENDGYKDEVEFR
ncbi:histidine kinase dimerization/phospho-acceptor domain-containing protein [Paenibacillus larvae]